MWRCMDSVEKEGRSGLVPVCIFIFLGVVFVGNLVVSNKKKHLKFSVTIRQNSINLRFFKEFKNLIKLNTTLLIILKYILFEI